MKYLNAKDVMIVFMLKMDFIIVRNANMIFVKIASISDQIKKIYEYNKILNRYYKILQNIIFHY